MIGYHWNCSIVVIIINASLENVNIWRQNCIGTLLAFFELKNWHEIPWKKIKFGKDFEYSEKVISSDHFTIFSFFLLEFSLNKIWKFQERAPFQKEQLPQLWWDNREKDSNSEIEAILKKIWDGKWSVTMQNLPCNLLT